MARKALHDVSPVMRHAFLEGLRRYARRRNKTLPEVCEEWWEESWQDAARVLASFQVRHTKVDAVVESGLPVMLTTFAREYEAEPLTSPAVIDLEPVESDGQSKKSH